MTTLCRRFKGRRVMRLIVTVPADTVATVDTLLALRPDHPARGCRSEYVRLALAEKLGRELMLSAEGASLARQALEDI